MLLIKNGKILTMANKVYERGHILVEGSKIIAISDNLEEIKDNNISRIIDASHCLVMPGLIDAHCHIGITEEKRGFEGDDSNEMTEPVTPYLKGLDGINPMDSAFRDALAAGITGVMTGPGSSNVVGGQFVFIKTFGRCVDHMVVLEPAAMKIAFGENIKSNYNEKNKLPTTRMSIAALLREELFNAKQYILHKENAKQDDNNFNLEFRKECWLPVFNHQIPLKAHVHRADDILTAIRIAKEFGLKLTLDHCTEGHLIAKEIKEAGFTAIVGSALTPRNKIETQYADFKTAGILHKEGIKVAITTDHPITRIQDLPLCAGLAAKAGLGVEESLKAITINAAEICNVAHRIGSIEVGKDADIAIFDGLPLETFTNTLYTIVNGEIVYSLQDNKAK